MASINQGGHFLLTEAFTENHLAKSINQGGRLKITALVSLLFFEAGGL